MDSNLITETVVSGQNELRKGQRIIYEGKEAEVIGVTPLITIKIEDRIICGSLSGQIEIIKELGD